MNDFLWWLLNLGEEEKRQLEIADRPKNETI